MISKYPKRHHKFVALVRKIVTLNFNLKKSPNLVTPKLSNLIRALNKLDSVRSINGFFFILYARILKLFDQSFLHCT